MQRANPKKEVGYLVYFTSLFRSNCKSLEADVKQKIAEKVTDLKLRGMYSDAASTLKHLSGLPRDHCDYADYWTYNSDKKALQCEIDVEKNEDGGIKHPKVPQVDPNAFLPSRSKYFYTFLEGRREFEEGLKLQMTGKKSPYYVSNLNRYLINVVISDPYVIALLRDFAKLDQVTLFDKIPLLSGEVSDKDKSDAKILRKELPKRADHDTLLLDFYGLKTSGGDSLEISNIDKFRYSSMQFFQLLKLTKKQEVAQSQTASSSMFTSIYSFCSGVGGEFSGATDIERAFFSKLYQTLMEFCDHIQEAFEMVIATEEGKKECEMLLNEGSKAAKLFLQQLKNDQLFFADVHAEYENLRNLALKNWHKDIENSRILKPYNHNPLPLEPLLKVKQQLRRI